MSIQDLSPGTMREHTRRWTDPTEPASQALANLPAASAMVPELHAVQSELASVETPSPSSPSASDAQLTTSLADTDTLFNNSVSGANFIFKGLIALSTGDQRATFKALQNKLLPRGPNIINASYREEAGEAQRLSAALTPDTLAVLTSIKLPWDNKTLADVFADIIAAANRLGTLDSERERLRQEAALPATSPAVGTATTTTTKTPTVASAKRRWVKAVKTLRQLVEIDKASPATQALLFATLDQDIAKTLIQP